MKTTTQLTNSLHSAATNAGFGSQLNYLQVEVEQMRDGTFVIGWNSEVLECDIDFDYQAILDRADKWLARTIAASK